jgi:hypothetical protein
MKRRSVNGGRHPMRTMRLVLVVSLLIGAFVSATQAADTQSFVPRQANLDLLLDTIRANRKAFVAVNLQLTPEESEKFWPLYDRYQQEMNVVGDRLAALVDDYIKNFQTMSNEKALEILNGYLAAEADRLAIRRKYVDEFAKILPGRTVGRFFQIENKMDAVLRYDLAATIPVVDEQPAGKK